MEPPFEAFGGEYNEAAEVAALFCEPINWMEEASLANRDLSIC